MSCDFQKFIDLGATEVKCVDGQLEIEAPDEAMPAIMAALTPGVPIIS